MSNNNKEANDVSGFDTSYSLRTHKEQLEFLRQVTDIDETGAAIRSVLEFFLDVVVHSPNLMSLYRHQRHDEYISVGDARTILLEFGLDRSEKTIQRWCKGGLLTSKKFGNSKNEDRQIWQISTSSLLDKIRNDLIVKPKIAT